MDDEQIFHCTVSLYDITTSESVKGLSCRLVKLPASAEGYVYEEIDSWNTDDFPE